MKTIVKAEFSAAFTQVSSVTRAFRNHSNMMIWFSRNYLLIFGSDSPVITILLLLRFLIIIMLKTVVLLFLWKL